MSVGELRECFINFFKKRGHKHLKSFSLVPPADETSLLLINSGMAPMKNWFLGVTKPVNRRVVSCQKCVRTTDLQNVGNTDRHGTFFEMLGNFSFGDYFKHEAIDFAWEFVTKELKIDSDKLYITVFENDDEAFNIWQNKSGITSGHIVKLGRADNFWEIGKGPCGPSSELYFDRGDEFGCGSSNCKPGCECDRFVEFWNLVFSQFCSDGAGNYSNLVNKNIDTGMGLERLACILQKTNSLFEIDSIKRILLEVCNISKIKYDKNSKLSRLVRIIVDHVRCSVFLISDGVMASNEGRGYVLRRLIRRALTCASGLKIETSFLKSVATLVITENKGFYKDLQNSCDKIIKVLENEEKSFEELMCRTQNRFFDLVNELKSKNLKIISGYDAFKLCDTYGMPFELLVDLANQFNFSIDEAGFTKLLNEQKNRARIDATSKLRGWSCFKKELLDGLNSEFVGYNSLKTTGVLEAIFVDGSKKQESIQGERVWLVFSKTPFYSTGGGQIADCGEAFSDDGFAKIVGCEKLNENLFIHEAIVSRGVLKVGNIFTLNVDEKRREAISRNHTAAHLLHQTLINVLGDGVRQAGQLINSEKLRFDFCFEGNLTCELLNEIETQVNLVVLKGFEIITQTMKLDEAKKLNAKALFDEKYGEVVRVVNVGNFSSELCGGTHLKNSGCVGLFKIVSESAVKAGVRRIEAKTGLNSLEYVQKMSQVSQKLCQHLKVANFDLLESFILDKFDELKLVRCENDDLKIKLISNLAKDKLKDQPTQLNGVVDVICFQADGINNKLLKRFALGFIKENQKASLIILSKFEDRLNVLVGFGELARQRGLLANEFVGQILQSFKGKGGGKVDIAVAGFEDDVKFDDLEKFCIAHIKDILNI